MRNQGLNQYSKIIIVIFVAELGSLFGISTRKLVLMLFMIQEWFFHSGMNRVEKLKMQG